MKEWIALAHRPRTVAEPHIPAVERPPSVTEPTHQELVGVLKPRSPQLPKLPGRPLAVPRVLEAVVHAPLHRPPDKPKPVVAVQLVIKLVSEEPQP